MKKILLFLLVFISINAMSQTDLIISEYVEGYSNNKALELYNPTNKAINLKGYQLVRYSNGKDVPPVGSNNWKIALPDFSLEPYRTYVIVLDKRNPTGSGQEAPVWQNLQQRADIFLCPVYNDSKAMYFNGDDAMALEKTDATLIDLFGRWGAPRPAEAQMPGSNKKVRCWTNTAPHFDGKGIGITADHTMIKKPTIDEGITENPTIFNPLADWDTLRANTFSHLGWHKYDKAPANETPAFEKEKYNFYFASNSENNTEAGKVIATDKENDAIKYYIEYGNFIYVDDKRIEPFKLDKETGIITLVKKEGMKPAIKDTFNLKIVATDGFSQTDEILAQIILDGTPPSNLVAEITLDKTEMSLEVEASDVITATVSPTTATDKTILWTSSDETIATVNDGTVTGVKQGETTIKATANDGSGVFTTCKVTVTPKTGVKDENIAKTITVYPNPVQNNTFKISAEQNIKHITVYNIVGRNVYNAIVNKKETNVYVPKVGAGVYFINITLQNQSTKTIKVIFE